MQIDIEEISLTKINPEPGDVLFFQLRSEGATAAQIKAFGDKLRTAFPFNKVILVNLGENDKMDLVSVKNVEYTHQKCENCTCKGVL